MRANSDRSAVSVSVLLIVIVLLIIAAVGGFYLGQYSSVHYTQTTVLFVTSIETSSLFATSISTSSFARCNLSSPLSLMSVNEAIHTFAYNDSAPSLSMSWGNCAHQEIQFEININSLNVTLSSHGQISTVRGYLGGESLTRYSLVRTAQTQLLSRSPIIQMSVLMQ